MEKSFWAGKRREKRRKQITDKKIKKRGEVGVGMGSRFIDRFPGPAYPRSYPGY